MSENVFIEQSNESALGPEYALVYNSFYKYKPSLIQMFEMKDFFFLSMKNLHFNTKVSKLFTRDARSD